MRSPCRLCDRPAECHGLCHAHHERWKRWGRPDLDGWAAAFLAGRLCTCAVCGGHWNGHKGSSTCSPECDRERRRVSALARWHARDPEAKRRAIDRSLALGRARRAEARTVKPCRRCGAPFEAWPAQKDCSDACRRATNRIAQREIRLRARTLGFAADSLALEQRLADVHDRADTGRAAR